MENFNKYLFIEELEKEIVIEIENGNCQCSDDYYTIMHESIDNACIYYADCFDICKELSATDFTAYHIECNTINQLAYAALYEYSLNELDVNKLDELINELETLNS